MELSTLCIHNVYYEGTAVVKRYPLRPNSGDRNGYHSEKRSVQSQTSIVIASRSSSS